MAPRTRVYAVTALAAAAVAAATIGATLLYPDPPANAAGARAGAPPFLLEASLDETPERRELVRGAELLERGERESAGEVFARLGSVEAQVGAALARWPRSSTRIIESVVREHPRDAFPRLHLGLARFWEGRNADAVAAWEAAAKAEPDSQSAVRANDLLYPEFARGLPTFTPSFPLEPVDAGAGSQRALIAEGVLAQRLGKPLSARRAYDRAVRAGGPDTLEARVAAAVARFDKANPSAAFSRLGPLSRDHPRSASVRFHLGLLLLWSGRLEPARDQLEQAVDADPGSPPAREAGRFLDRLESIE